MWGLLQHHCDSCFQRIKMEKAQQNVRNAVNDTMDDLDKSHLRPLQGKMHDCASQCCRNKKASMEEVQKCMESCSRPLVKVQTLIEQEMKSFQDRLTRCAQGCQDEIRDKVGSGTKESEIPNFDSQLEKCVTKCADDHIGLLPKMLTRLRDGINKESK